MRCRARIDKEDFPVRYSIRFRNPFRIPTASSSSLLPFFRRPRPPSIARGGRSRTGYRTSVFSVFASFGAADSTAKFHARFVLSRSIQAPFSGSPSTVSRFPFPGLLSSLVQSPTFKYSFPARQVSKRKEGSRLERVREKASEGEGSEKKQNRCR